MSNIRFNLRPNRTKDHSIQMIYRIKGGGKLVIGTGIHVPQKYWNPQPMRVRENAEFLDSFHINV